MADGWIKLHRNITEHWIWQDEPYDKARAWIDLLFLANYEDTKTAYKGEVITCKRGEVNFSIAYFANRWKWSRKKVTAFLKLLESDGMVTTKATTHRTTITIENYGFYQGEGTTKVATKVATRVTTEEQQENTIKKEKKDKKVKNNKYIAPKIIFGEYKHVKLTEDEFVRLGRDYGSDKRDAAIKFLDEYIEQKPGYKNENHNLCLRNWVFNAVEERKRKSVSTGTKPMLKADYDMDALERMLTGETDEK